MRAKFCRAGNGELGIEFEPENSDEQLLLEIFTKRSLSIGHRFEFRGFDHNNHGHVLREGLTAVRGEIVAGVIVENTITVDTPKEE